VRGLDSIGGIATSIATTARTNPRTALAPKTVGTLLARGRCISLARSVARGVIVGSYLWILAFEETVLRTLSDCLPDSVSDSLLARPASVGVAPRSSSMSGTRTGRGL
jgi:hypothetical protein